MREGKGRAHLDSELSDIQGGQSFTGNVEHLGIGDHGVICSGDIEILIQTSQVPCQLSLIKMECARTRNCTGNSHTGRILSYDLCSSRVDLFGTPCRCGTSSWKVESSWPST
jgi:hypothetical protein